MSTPKFKIGDRVVLKGTLGTDVIERVREDEPNAPYYRLASRFGWWHESLLSLDVPAEPKFKIGDRVKWVWGRIGVIAEAHEDNRYSFKTPMGWASKVPGDQLVLDVPETHKFKIGDRVKWVNFGKPSFGFVRARISEGWWEVEYKTGCIAGYRESHLSLDVPETPKFNIGDRVKWDQCGRIGVVIQGHADNRYTIDMAGDWISKIPGAHLSLEVPGPKQFATKLEVELGAEIIKLHYDVAHLDARLTEEVGGRHRERIAKEAVQKELAEVRPALVRERAILADIYNAMLKPRI